MEKRKGLLTAIMLLTSVMIQAKVIKLVIKPTENSTIGRTEIFVGPSPKTDTINVFPGVNVTELSLTLKKTDGEVILSELIPLTIPETYNIITPHMPEGFLLEIKDNNGTVYTSIEEED